MRHGFYERAVIRKERKKKSYRGIADGREHGKMDSLSDITSCRVT